MKGLQSSGLIGNWPFSYDGLALSTRGSQEMKPRHAPWFSVAIIRGSAVEIAKKNCFSTTTAKKVSTHPRTCSIGRPAGGTLCPHPITLQMASSAGQKKHRFILGGGGRSHDGHRVRSNCAGWRTLAPHKGELSHDAV